MGMGIDGRYPAGPIIGIAILIALTLGLVVFLAIAFTGRKKS